MNDDDDDDDDGQGSSHSGVEETFTIRFNSFRICFSPIVKGRRLEMSLSKDLVFLILQFCDEENLKKTAHMLEQETCYFFDLKYFEELVLNGNWEEVGKYLSSFTDVEDNKYSTKIYFEIRKQKYLEALDKHEFSAALAILHKDLKVFSQSNRELYKEMAQLLAGWH